MASSAAVWPGAAAVIMSINTRGTATPSMPSSHDAPRAAPGAARPRSGGGVQEVSAQYLVEQAAARRGSGTSRARNTP